MVELELWDSISPFLDVTFIRNFTINLKTINKAPLPTQLIRLHYYHNYPQLGRGSDARN